MNKIQILLWLLILLNLCSACEKEAISWDEYKQALASDPYFKKKNVGEIDMYLQCLPSSYLAYKELSTSKGAIQTHEFDSVKATYENTLYFIFSISTEKGHDLLLKNTLSYSELVNKLYEANFLFQEVFYLQNEKGVILKAGGVIFDNAPHTGEGLKWTVVFDKDKVAEMFHEEKAKLVFEDPYWKTGKNYFSLAIGDLESLPKLKIQ